MTLTLAVDAGTPYDTIQWFKNGTIIEGETGLVYTKATVVSGDAGNYHAIVKNGTAYVKSETCVVTIT